MCFLGYWCEYGEVMPETTAVLAGHGPGFCESFAYKLGASGYNVALIARSEDYLLEFATELNNAGCTAGAFPCDLTNPENAKETMQEINREFGSVSVLAHTASTVPQSEREELDIDRFETLWQLYARAGLVCFKECLPDLRETEGTALFFGASRSAGDFAFKSAKDATRGLARSLANQYGPEGIHVTHVVINGMIRNPDVFERYDDLVETELIDPDGLAETCMGLVEQPARSRTFELDVHAAQATPTV